ncbi:hypothetical protein [Paenibacillus sp. FSL K6-2393]|uniref:hypothetical protein n=1 Tax=Paenibacillus sp. FSL K6-2393 TaxID=2921475 RepID=UPI0030F5440E
MDALKTWFSTMTFDSQHCFLCGVSLNGSNSTVEHVFPKWLQHKHNLWDQTMGLPNKSLIKYRQLVVPCCKECNNGYLANLEDTMKNAFSKGVEHIRELDSTIIYRWLMKILYCLMYKDLSLSWNRKDKESGTILTPEFLSEHKLMFDCMQSIRGNIALDPNYASIFIFEVHKHISNDKNKDFFYADDLIQAQIVIQSGEIGIVCCFGDNKAIERRLSRYLKPFKKIKLHQIQFRQIIADVYYNRTLLKGGSTGILTKDQVLFIPPYKNTYDEYNYKNYAIVLYYFLRDFDIEFEKIYSEEVDAVLNLLINNDKRIIIYDDQNNYSLGDIHNEYSGELFENKNEVNSARYN